MRSYSNFRFGIAMMMAPTGIAVTVWALSRIVGKQLEFLPLIFFGIPLQLVVAWALWHCRGDFVRIVFDPDQRSITVRRLVPGCSFSCSVDDVAVESEGGVAGIGAALDTSSHIHRVRAGSETIFTYRTFSQSRIRAMLEEWCSPAPDS